MRMREVHLTMRTEGITAFPNRYGVVVWTGENDTKTISVDANLFENGLVWTGPIKSFITLKFNLTGESLGRLSHILMLMSQHIQILNIHDPFW